MPRSDPPDDARPLPATAGLGETLLQLARSGTEPALERLRGLSPERIASALPELAPAQRVELLEAAEQVDEIVPLIPEADFTITVRSAGIEESGWLVEFASPEQRVAAVDLDCWKDDRLSPGRLFEWIDALIEAGPETLAAAFDELDPEIWVLAMKEMGDFSVLGIGDLDAGGGQTQDGLVFYEARTAESEDRIREILGVALQYAPTHYWRLVYGAISESEVETKQFAARWQRNRLGDLGFPDRERAMRAYRPLRVADAPELGGAYSGPGEAESAPTGPLPAQLDGSLVARALAGLPAQRSIERMGDILIVANTLAVADELSLTAPDTIERSLAKALRGIDRGLAEVASARDAPLRVVLDGTAPLDLFRIGATLEPDLRGRGAAGDADFARPRDDWGVELEEIDALDRTLGPDGRPRGD